MCVGAQMEQTEAQLLSLVSGIAATVGDLSAAAGIEPHATPNGRLSVDLDALGGGSARTPSGPLPPLPHVPQVPASDADSPGDSPGFEPQGGTVATPVAMVAAAGAKAEERTARMRKKSAEQEGAAADEQP